MLLSVLYLYLMYKLLKKITLEAINKDDIKNKMYFLFFYCFITTISLFSAMNKLINGTNQLDDFIIKILTTLPFCIVFFVFFINIMKTIKR